MRACVGRILQSIYAIKFHFGVGGIAMFLFLFLQLMLLAVVDILFLSLSIHSYLRSLTLSLSHALTLPAARFFRLPFWIVNVNWKQFKMLAFKAQSHKPNKTLRIFFFDNNHTRIHKQCKESYEFFWSCVWYGLCVCMNITII